MIEKFRQAIVGSGLDFSGDIIPDSKLHRVHVQGDKSRSLNGWYVLNVDGKFAAGAFGCWKRNVSEKWSNRAAGTGPPVDDGKLARQMEEMRKARNVEEYRAHAECRTWCRDNWRKAVPAESSHSYLQTKGILAYEIKQLNGNLLIPLLDSAGQMHGLQFISPSGAKRFKSGTVKHGNYFLIGEPDNNTLLIAEGYATGASLYESTGHAVVVAFDAGNLLSVAKNIRKKFPDYRLILCGDNDESGRGQEAARVAALAVDGLVAVPETVGEDFNDLHQARDTDAVLDCVNAASATTRDDSMCGNGENQQQVLPKSVANNLNEDLRDVPLGAMNAGQSVVSQYSKFGFNSATDLIREIKPTQWLVDGVLEEEALGVLFAAPGSYKTFLAISLGLSIATGTPWYGHSVRKGLVVFIIGEGGNGFAKRLKAWSIGVAVSVEGAHMIVSNAPAQLSDDGFAKHVKDCIDAQSEKYGEPVLVVIDTLARNFGGDENSTQDMSKFIGNLDNYLGNKCTRLIVHHTGHGDKNRSRGSSALKGAVDVELMLERKLDDVVTLSCQKMKDARPFGEMSFCPVETAIETTDPKRPGSSLYLVETERKLSVNEPKLSSNMRMALKLLKIMSSSEHQKDSLEKCLICTSDWMDFCMEEQVYTRSALYTAIKTMEGKGFLEITGSYVSLS